MPPTLRFDEVATLLAGIAENDTVPLEKWSAGETYEPYVGRWSRLVAAEFVEWLEIPDQARSLDVGCGTGALTATLATRHPDSEVVGIDPSRSFVTYAAAQCPSATFHVGTAAGLPFRDAAFGAAVSGLVLNFVPDPLQMLSEMRRVVQPSGWVGLYVWDYSEGMQLMRRFWDAAVTLDPDARDHDEAVRFPICRPDPLLDLFASAGLTSTELRAVEIPTVFTDFDDFWGPFLVGQAPAPAYVASLDHDRRTRLRDLLHRTLPVEQDGSIRLTARAWALRAVR